MRRAVLAVVTLGCAVQQTPSGEAIVIGGGEPGAAGFAREPAKKLLTTKIPYQEWPALPGRTIGLMAALSPSWGPNPGWTRQPWPVERGRGGNAWWYFMSGGHSPWASYWDHRDDPAAKVQLDQWQVPLADGTIARYDAVQYQLGERNPWGLSDEAHLVEIEINDGRGSKPSYLHFVITDARVVDGSDAYPIRVADTLRDARKRWDAYVAAEEQTVAARLDEANRAAAGEPYGEETTEAQEAVFPTWDADRAELRVLFYQQVMRSSHRFEPVQSRHCPEGAPCMREPERPEVLRRTYGVELGLELVWDRRGKLVRGTYFTPSVLGGP